MAKIFAQLSQNLAEQKADALEHNISLFSHKMALANQKAGALEMLLGTILINCKYYLDTVHYDST